MSEFDQTPQEPEAAPEPVEAAEAAPEPVEAAEAAAEPVEAIEVAPEEPAPALDQTPPPVYEQAPPPPVFEQAPPPPVFEQAPPPVYQAPPAYEQPQYQTPPPQYQTPPPQYQAPPQYSYQNGPPYMRGQNDGLFTAALIFMILATIGVFFSGFATFGIAFIGLAWCIPMTVRTSKIRKGLKPNTTGFGVCCLLFAGIIPGVLLLVAPKDK